MVAPGVPSGGALSETADRAVRPAPQTAKGRRTRCAIVDAARTVFADVGYAAASVASIAKVAGVAHGSFYVYFPSKREVFAELAGEAMEQIFASTRAPSALHDPVDRLEWENRRFFELYRAHARMFQLIDEAVHVDEDFRRTWTTERHRRVGHLARAISRLRESGRAGSVADPVALAEALGAMAERLAHLTTVDDTLDPEVLLATLNGLWRQALGVDEAVRRG